MLSLETYPRSSYLASEKSGIEWLYLHIQLKRPLNDIFSVKIYIL
jgi:hypothetical protein